MKFCAKTRLNFRNACSFFLLVSLVNFLSYYIINVLIVFHCVLSLHNEDSQVELCSGFFVDKSTKTNTNESETNSTKQKPNIHNRFVRDWPSTALFLPIKRLFILFLNSYFLQMALCLSLCLLYLLS